MSYEPKVKDWKKEEVEKFTELLGEYEVIGVLNMKNLPARQLQNMRATLRDTVFMRMTKKRLMKRALENSDKKGIKDLLNHMKGMPALLFSNENPFKLYSILKQNKSKAPIKGGQEAPNDIVVPEGPTNFPPGPIIGELGNLGIPAGVEEGKVAVQKETVVAEEGEEVSEELAAILTRLGIEPMEVGLDLVAVYEDGEILTKDVLDIDTEQYAQDFKTAASWAFNLSVEAGFPTADNVPLLLMKGHGDALALAQSQDILTDETVKNVLAKAAGAAKSLEASIDIEAHMKEAKEEPKEEKADEEKEQPAEEQSDEAGEEPAEKDETDGEEKEESKDEKEEQSDEDSEEKKKEADEKPAEEDEAGDEEKAEETKEETSDEESSEEKESPSRNEIESMTKDEIKEYADEQFGIELSTDDLKAEMIDQLFNEIENE